MQGHKLGDPNQLLLLTLCEYVCWIHIRRMSGLRHFLQVHLVEGAAKKRPQCAALSICMPRHPFCGQPMCRRCAVPRFDCLACIQSCEPKSWLKVIADTVDGISFTHSGHMAQSCVAHSLICWNLLGLASFSPLEELYQAPSTQVML